MAKITGQPKKFQLVDPSETPLAGETIPFYVENGFSETIQLATLGDLPPVLPQDPPVDSGWKPKVDDNAYGTELYGTVDLSSYGTGKLAILYVVATEGGAGQSMVNLAPHGLTEYVRMTVPLEATVQGIYLVPMINMQIDWTITGVAPAFTVMEMYLIGLF